jgi:hypothetical protein
MQFSFWEDDVSKRLASRKGSASLLWKISNAAGKLAFFSLIAGVLLILTVTILPSIIGRDGAAPAFVTDVFPVLAMLAIILGGLCTSIYGICVALLAFSLDEPMWGCVIGAASLLAVIFSGLGAIIAVYYKNKKAGEILGATPGR